MTYTLVQPPFTLKFREMTKPELTGYFEWFVRIIPQRLAELQCAVRASPGHSSWSADLSPASLEPLGDWFAGQVEAQPRTVDEIEAVEARLTFPIDVPAERLTNRTLSLVVDIGMYFSQVILENLAGTKWNQGLKNPKFADYGQPVIMGFGSVPLNPVRIVLSTAYAFADREQRGGRLRELYDTWAKMRKP